MDKHIEFRKNFLKLLKESINLRRISNSNIREIVLYYLQYRCKVKYSKILKMVSQIDDSKDLLLLKVFNDKEWFDFIMDIIANWGPGHLFNGNFSGPIRDSYDMSGNNGSNSYNLAINYGSTPTKRIKNFLKQVEDLWYTDKIVQSSDYRELILEYVQYMNKDIVIVVFNLDKDEYLHYALVNKDLSKQFIRTISKFDIDRKFRPEWFTPYKRLPYLIHKGVKL